MCFQEMDPRVSLYTFSLFSPEELEKYAQLDCGVSDWFYLMLLLYLDWKEHVNIFNCQVFTTFNW